MENKIYLGLDKLIVSRMRQETANVGAFQLASGNSSNLVECEVLVGTLVVPASCVVLLSESLVAEQNRTSMPGHDGDVFVIPVDKIVCFRRPGP